MRQEFQHEYKGYHGTPSTCSVRVFSDEAHIIYFEDLNHGTSVTNMSEQLATEIVNLLKLSPEDCRFFETYDREDFDEITYDWDLKRGKWEASKPEWKPAESFFINLFFV